MRRQIIAKDKEVYTLGDLIWLNKEPYEGSMSSLNHAKINSMVSHSK